MLLPRWDRLFCAWEAPLQTIFVNYRRADSEGEAGRLFDDVSAIEPGRDFRKAIDQSVATCSILLAVIGQEWLELKDAHGGRRLDDPNDFVRIELASALRRDIPVVPVLVRGAKMPRVEQLPDDLKELAYRNAVELTHARWRSDVQVLMQALRPYLGDTPANGAKAAVQEASGGQASGIWANTAAVASGVEAQTLERVGKRLAEYIGPIAEVVVKRAAKRCCSVEELYEMASREIEGEAERARFLRACRVG